MQIRKQVYELTRQDLVEHPAWEFALDEEGEDEQDEATVRPITVDENTDWSDLSLVVRAEFTLSDGSEMTGYLTPPQTSVPSILTIEGDDEISRVQPVIVTDKGQVPFWHGIMKPSESEVSRLYELLGKSASIFPVRYRSSVAIGSSPVEGEIQGFGYLEERKSGFFGKKKLFVASTQ